MDSHLPIMLRYPDQQRRNIPMATVPKNGLICLTSFNEKKFSGLQQRPLQTRADLKTRPPTSTYTGFSSNRSTCCHLVRHRFRRDLEKGQDILWANERLDNLHTQITTKIGEGTRNLQQGILDYVNKISGCLRKKTSFQSRQASILSGGNLYEVNTKEKHGINNERKKEEERITEDQTEVKESESKQEGMEIEDQESEEEKVLELKKNEVEENLESERSEEQKRKEEKKLNDDETNNKTISISTPEYHLQEQRWLQLQQMEKTCKIFQSEIKKENGEIGRDFLFGIDSTLTINRVQSSLHFPSSDVYQPNDDYRQTEKAKRNFLSRRMTYPNLNLKFSSNIWHDT